MLMTAILGSVLLAIMTLHIRQLAASEAPMPIQNPDKRAGMRAD